MTATGKTNLDTLAIFDASVRTTLADSSTAQAVAEVQQSAFSSAPAADIVAASALSSNFAEELKSAGQNNEFYEDNIGEQDQRISTKYIGVEATTKTLTSVQKVGLFSRKPLFNKEGEPIMTIKTAEEFNLLSPYSRDVIDQLGYFQKSYALNRTKSGLARFENWSLGKMQGPSALDSFLISTPKTNQEKVAQDRILYKGLNTDEGTNKTFLLNKKGQILNAKEFFGQTNYAAKQASNASTELQNAKGVVSVIGKGIKFGYSAVRVVAALVDDLVSGLLRGITHCLVRIPVIGPLLALCFSKTVTPAIRIAARIATTLVTFALGVTALVTVGALIGAIVLTCAAIAAALAVFWVPSFLIWKRYNPDGTFVQYLKAVAVTFAKVVQTVVLTALLTIGIIGSVTAACLVTVKTFGAAAALGAFVGSAIAVNVGSVAAARKKVGQMYANIWGCEGPMDRELVDEKTKSLERGVKGSGSTITKAQFKKQAYLSLKLEKIQDELDIALATDTKESARKYSIEKAFAIINDLNETLLWYLFADKENGFTRLLALNDERVLFADVLRRIHSVHQKYETMIPKSYTATETLQDNKGENVDISTKDLLDSKMASELAANAMSMQAAIRVQRESLAPRVDLAGRVTIDPLTDEQIAAANRRDAQLLAEAKSRAIRETQSGGLKA